MDVSQLERITTDPATSTLHEGFRSRGRAAVGSYDRELASRHLLFDSAMRGINEALVARDRSAPAIRTGRP